MSVAMMSTSSSPSHSLTELTDGPYLVLASYLDEYDLCQTDASCHQLKTLNSTLGLWRTLGASVYNAIELEREGIFDHGSAAPSKRRYSQFKQEILNFQSPLEGSEITGNKNPDQVAYCRCKLRTDVLNAGAEANEGVYMEVEVLMNVDSLSLVLCDFDDGQRSSVTFSPDAGAVLKEQKVLEKMDMETMQAAYIQPLESNGCRFEGTLGLYVCNGQIAFFRKYRKQDGETEEPKWESTGFVIDLSWAEGRALTPCIAFRDPGSYHVRMAEVGSCPPICPETLPAYQAKDWTELNWDAVQVQESVEAAQPM